MLFQDHKFDISQVIEYFKTKVFDHFYYFTKNRNRKTSATDLRIQEDSLCRYVYMLAKFICLVMSCDEVKYVIFVFIYLSINACHHEG